MFAWTRVVTGRYERWLDSRYILKADIKDLQMDWEYQKKRRIMDGSKAKRPTYSRHYLGVLM